MIYALLAMLAFGLWMSLISPDIRPDVSLKRRFLAFGVWLCVMFFAMFPIAVSATWPVIFVAQIVGVTLISLFTKIINGDV